MSQDELQKRTDVDRAYISKIERGEIQIPGISVLERLAEGLEIPIEQLAPAKYYATAKRESSESSIVAMIWADTTLSESARKRGAECVRDVYNRRKSVDKSA